MANYPHQSMARVGAQFIAPFVIAILRRGGRDESRPYDQLRPVTQSLFGRSPRPPEA